MGDYRFRLKISFKMGNVADNCDVWLNYSRAEFTNIDRSVEKWLDDLFERGVRNIVDGKMNGADVEARKKECKEAEDEVLKEADKIRKHRNKEANK